MNSTSNLARGLLLELAADVNLAGLDPSPVLKLAEEVTGASDPELVLEAIKRRPKHLTARSLEDYLNRVRRALT